MAKENNRLKLKLSRMFSSSCITQDISNVIDHQKPLVTPLIDLEQRDDGSPFSSPVIRPPKQPALFSSCKPRCPQSFDQMVRESCLLSRRKFAGKYSILSPSENCPPASPLFRRNNKKKERNNLVKTHLKNHNRFNFSSSNDTDWFSSDDDREEEDEKYRKTESTLFSSFHKSISLFSDSETWVPNQRGSGSSGSGSGSSWVIAKRGEMETFAVVKSSSDPYSDFRTSMAEMIIEKQIIGEKELENLLQCFLSLNSTYHHRVILEVFTEIWDALFS